MEKPKHDKSSTKYVLYTVYIETPKKLKNGTGLMREERVEYIVDMKRHQNFGANRVNADRVVA